MMKINRKQFEKLVNLCRNYDMYTCYIDSYTQMQSAQNINSKLNAEFKDIMKEFGIDADIPYTCMNKGADTAEYLTVWLLGKEIEVEKESKRVWTAEEIKNLVQTNDKVLYGALKNLYNCQTADEQHSAETTHANGAGFNAIDAEFLTSVSQFLIKRGFLTDKQKVIVRKKLVKYNKQLTALANA